MRITVFTSNQPRHLSYIARLASIATEVYVVMEVNTLFPGKVKDFFDNSETMRSYFTRVQAAETRIFGGVGFTPGNVKVLPVKSGDLNFLLRKDLSEAMESDYFLVFGSSYIKGWLVQELVQKGAVNIHMGLSPYYRGSSCNFWALYDDRPAYVGATVHLLSEGLDSGPVLFHVRPDFYGQDLFDFTMESVNAVQNRIVGEIQSGQIGERKPQFPESSEQLRYTRDSDFDDQVALEFLERRYSDEHFLKLIGSGQQPHLIA